MLGRAGQGAVTWEITFDSAGGVGTGQGWSHRGGGR